MKRKPGNIWMFAMAVLIFHNLSTGCVTGRGNISTPAAAEQQRLYWKVYPKSDNTFYILPRPELTKSLSTPSAMNSLGKEQAESMARNLNSALQFTIEVSNEGGTRMVRVNPEPLLEDLVDICKTQGRHPFMDARCKKELAWASKGERPDIYLQFDDCEAVAFASALNKIYRKPQARTNLCPAWNQVEK